VSGPAIRVENLGKMYRIGGPVERYRTFRDTVAQGFARAGRRVRSWFGGGNGAAPKYETIWALKDVSFEIQPGEVMGVIGRNGAGKSTLLKILSRITEPTEGRAVVRGRVGSLLEVGTGFHPELTGRENVYLNGAILGMKRAEVDRKFDEIVAFAEIEKFIDTPVKHYSSGMYVRLAFSVAAHLDTDILLVDEVLSVGDAAFQGKCLGKMSSVAGAGRTVLFVSHQLGTIGHLCQRGIVLAEGKVYTDSEATSAIQEYYATLSQKRAGESGCSVWISERKNSLIKEIRLYDRRSGISEWISGREAVMEYVITSSLKNSWLCFTIYDPVGTPVTHCTTKDSTEWLEFSDQAPLVLRWTCKELPLTPGQYRLNVALQTPGGIIEHIRDPMTINVRSGVCYGRPVRERQAGTVVLDYSWHATPFKMEQQ